MTIASVEKARAGERSILLAQVTTSKVRLPIVMAHGQPQLTPTSNADAYAIPAGQQSPLTFEVPMETNELAASPTPLPRVNICPPRSLITRDSRPNDLLLSCTNGLTTIRPDELKRQISDARSSTCDTRAQVPRPKKQTQPTENTLLGKHGQHAF